MFRIGSTGERGEAMAAVIGAEIRSVRLARSLSMRELAKRVGTSQPFVSNIENGRIFPSVRTLGLLAEALDVPVSRLLPAVERAERAPATAGMRPRRRHEPAGRLLLSGQDRRLAASRVELRPGESEPRPLMHDGEDLVTVVSGELDVLREGEPPSRLRAGETLWLDG